MCVLTFVDASTFLGFRSELVGSESFVGCCGRRSVLLFPYCPNSRFDFSSFFCLPYSLAADRRQRVLPFSRVHGGRLRFFFNDRVRKRPLVGFFFTFYSQLTILSIEGTPIPLASILLVWLSLHSGQSFSSACFFAGVASARALVLSKRSRASRAAAPS